MKYDKCRTGFDEVPFPLAGKSQGQREEDAFMEEHGGIGCSALYQVIEALWVVGEATTKFIRSAQKPRVPQAKNIQIISKKRHS